MVCGPAVWSALSGLLCVAAGMRMIERPHYLTGRREFLGSLIGSLGDMPRLRAIVVGVNRTVEELTDFGGLHVFLGSA